MTWNSSLTLAARSLFWAVLFPGIVAFYVPLRYFGVDLGGDRNWTALDVPGFAITAAGSVLLGACIIEFARSGRGTLSPVDPPRHLVVGGLYRYVRNPMYLSVSMILLGEVMLTRSRPLVMYWAIWFAAVNLFVVAYEEPWLRSQFGASYDAYAARVGRWMPTWPH